MAKSNKAGPHLQPTMNLGMRDCGRYVTSHDSNGKSVFTPSPELLYYDRGGYGVSRSYAVSKVPAILREDQDLKEYLTDDRASESSYIHAGVRIVVPGGLNFVTVDFGPGAQTKMHRTVSLDFVAIVEGEIELELDSGEKQLLKSGDTIVQRGTMHRWTNPSQDKPVRFVGVMAAADGIEVAEKLLDDEFAPESH